jgi:hypothetical protein
VFDARICGMNVFGQMLFAHISPLLGASLRKVNGSDARPFPGHSRFDFDEVAKRAGDSGPR